MASQRRSQQRSAQGHEGKAEDHRAALIVPSIDRSIDPMMMMKVTPMATMSAGVEAMAMRAKIAQGQKARD